MSEAFLRMRYIGVCSLLARLSRSVRDDSDMECIEAALTDAAKELDFRVGVVAVGGFTFEPSAQRGGNVDPVVLDSEETAEAALDLLRRFRSGSYDDSIWLEIDALLEEEIDV